MTTLADVIAFLSNEDSCTLLYGGDKIAYLNDAGAPDDNSRWFVAGHEFGATHLVHVWARGSSDGFESAWGVWIDESATVPEEVLVEAYTPGRDKGSFLDEAYSAGLSGDAAREHAKAALAKADEDARAGVGEYPELVEGYEYQSNASGTGIVDVGHYSWMREAEPCEIEIVVSDNA